MNRREFLQRAAIVGAFLAVGYHKKATPDTYGVAIYGDAMYGGRRRHPGGGGGRRLVAS